KGQVVYHAAPVSFPSRHAAILTAFSVYFAREESGAFKDCFRGDLFLPLNYIWPKISFARVIASARIDRAYPVRSTPTSFARNRAHVCQIHLRYRWSCIQPW